MSSYKLTYFDARGRGELCRLIFAAAGVQYEDNRLDLTLWQTFKSTTPFGQLPVLEVDGVTLCQSNAIARYLARKFNLAGKNELDQAKTDMIVDCFEDTLKPLGEIVHVKDEACKAEKRKKYEEEQLPNYLRLLEEILKGNNGGDGFFVGDSLTWSDLWLIIINEWLAYLNLQSELPKHEKLDALRQRVEQLPKVAEWLAKRPVTQF